ncbi:VOC family protein [Planctobacterium marinum]|uniref:VOC family protein n=1 Tax=Planctobacterium marinum TaxID=1631968 RepID=UPI001E5FC89B|nr:VOC family protein [Planctobacterium marinum]MCC2605244.1 VOC family protein [Planctobacterium marinum]
MKLGKFCLSLSVTDIDNSKHFYEKLGFSPVPGCGSVEAKWLIMQNGTNMIGLFQDMFHGNIFTFNPKDVHKIQDELKAKGIHLDKEAASADGPSHIMFRDPDGNVIMLDQI